MYTNVRLERDPRAAETFWLGTFYTSLDRYRHQKLCGLNRDLSNIFLFNRRIIQGSLFEYGSLLDVVPRAEAKVVHFDKKKFAGKHGL